MTVRFNYCYFFLAVMVICARINAYGQTKEYTGALIERFDPKLDEIIKKSAKVEIIADGFTWVEGPLWVESQKMLLVSDVFSNEVYKWTWERGKELFLAPSGYTQPTPRGEELGSNGLALNHEGQLLLCQHGDRRVALLNSPLTDPKPTYMPLARSYNGKRFNSPNDLAVRSNGEIYFTDPPYGLEKGMDDPSKELSYQGVYKIEKDGKVTLLVDTLTRPNGIAFFPDEKSLIIANSDAQKPHWYIYDLDEEGRLINGRIFFNGSAVYKKEQRSPDGIKIDRAGNVFAAGPGGVWIFNKEGKELGRIKVNVVTSNCAFTNDGNTLFITADKYLLKVNLR